MLNKDKFYQMVPEIKKIITIVEEINKSKRENNSKEFTNEREIKRIIKDIKSGDNLRNKFYKYLFKYDFEELRIIKSFMLTGKDIFIEMEDLDRETLISLFEEHYQEFDFPKNKTAIAGYISEKEPLDLYLTKGLNAFKKIY